MSLLHTLAVGPLETNCYLYADEATRECAIIDPGDDEDRIVAALTKHDLRPTMILLTHAHFDHIGAVAALKRRYSPGLSTQDSALSTQDSGLLFTQHSGLRTCFLRVGLSQAESPALEDARYSGATWFCVSVETAKADFFIGDGDVLRLGETTLTALSTPGHSAGGLSFVGDGVVFVGDVLFRDGIGRYDLPGADFEALKRSLARLLELADETKVYPGHGPETTIGRERRSNPYLVELGVVRR